jgi:molybdenum cofactor synthesis domain-containing protein
MKTAAMLVIGNEILSGKIRDSNAYYLSRQLRILGTQLEKIVFVLDRYEDIAKEITVLSEKYDFVFTSGGVGPTHDDITIDAIARAFHTPTYLNENLKQLLMGYFKEQLTDAHLRMATIPEGTQLLETSSNHFPVYQFKNIFILPGVPHIFERKFEKIAHLFKDGQFYLRCIYLNVDEGQIAKILEEVEKSFEVSIGSYPIYQEAYSVKITIESRNLAPVNEAVESLIMSMDPSVIYQVDPILI